MKIRINKAACVGNARCAAIAPELFPLNEEGYIAVEEINVPPGQEALARRASMPRTHYRCGRRREIT